jgi:hypothetical protein
MQFFWGVFIAELQNHQPANDFLAYRPRICNIILAPVLIILGLYLASFPENNVEWMPWSDAQFTLLKSILPHDSDIPKFASGLGLELITLGLHFSVLARNLLSMRWFLWLGKQSFAVYLLHGTMIRTALVWMVYGISVPTDLPAFTQNDDGEDSPVYIPYTGHTRLMLSLPIWLPMVYGLAALWTSHVDPWCASITERLVKYVKASEEEKLGALLPA